MNNAKRTAYNMIAQIVSFALNLGINFFLTPYVTSYVGKEIYGYVMMAYQITDYANIIVVAFNSLLARYIIIKLRQNKEEDARYYFVTVTFVNVIIALIMLIPSAFAIVHLQRLIVIPEGFVTDVKLLWAFIFFSVLISIATTTFHVSTFVANRLDLEGIRGMQNNILRCVLLVAMFAFLSPKIWYVGFTALICNLYLTYITFGYWKRLTPQLYIKKKYFKLKSIVEILLNSVWNAVNQLASILLDGLDIIISNLFLGALEMTLMSCAKTMPTRLTALVAMIANVFNPNLISVYAEGDMEKFIEEVKKATRICMMICTIPFIGFIVFGYDFISLWLPAYDEREVMTIQILAVMSLLPSLCSVYVQPLGSVQTITCKLKVPVMITFAIGVVNIISAFVLLKTTSLGVYSIRLVSGVLLILRWLVFTPLYTAHNIQQRPGTFYPVVFRGILSSILVAALYIVVVKNIELRSWGLFLVVAGICGIMGYIINYFVILEKEEQEMIKKKLCSLLKTLKK